MRGQGLVLALMVVAGAGGAVAMPQNETCRQDDGSCGANPLQRAVLPSMLSEADQALLGRLERELDHNAMKPASFPNFSPVDEPATVNKQNLTPPRSRRSRGSKSLSTESRGVLSTGSVTAGGLDAGLFGSNDLF
eukprot:CAMPEP_0184310642 /NCGR_PEP_ID=MMETSP1049-20130417/32612_1 /TAXON_ID=77928 /ORGANISM="Proteomonas sulcata, Strain CCMP704" /LENGTH=134 /DNA_ID=CAMNT_0026625085 /DNA_START=210 /DNA_END=614 /DNA_ORIENTATION=+